MVLEKGILNMAGMEDDGMDVKIVRAEYEHLPSLANHLRDSDRLELYASMGGTTLSALEISFERSIACWCLLVGDEPILVWGVAPYDALMGPMGMPWMVGTAAMQGWQQYIGRRIRHYIALMHYLYPCLVNYVHAGNAQARRFLLWCGFRIHWTPLRVGGEIFYEARRTICVE